MDDFQDVLKQAADIKTAQLKERPGRQEWERAPDWIKYTAFEDKQVTAVRDKPVFERLTACKELKEQGNAEYEAEDIEAALSLYTRALSIFVWFDRGKDRCNEDIPWVNSINQLEEGPVKGEVNGLVTALFNNAASCLLKMKNFDAAVYAASKALQHDPYSVKALYRRASAHHYLGTTAGLEAAVKDLQKAQGLEPGNAHVRIFLDQCQKELLQQKRKDAAIYGNMFSRGRLYDDAGGDAHGDVQEDHIGRDKSHDLAPREVDHALRGMQRGMARAQARVAQRHAAPPSLLRESLAPFTFLPWWAWMLIVLHLLYRMAKVLDPITTAVSAS